MTGYAMFHVAQKYLASITFTAVVLCLLALAPAESGAGVRDSEMADHIATLLGEKFAPESLVVSVLDSRAYAEMRGAILSGIRIDAMKLDALLTNSDGALSDDVDSLASLIGYSKGEITLLEKDVNAYFEGNDKKGFSRLAFDFKPDGFRADGIFSAEFLFTLKIRLAATGVLALKSDGVYLDDVSIYVEKVRQPSMLTNQIISRVNPLLKWSGIPFKVVFNEVTMDDDAARMSGGPQKYDGGSEAEWAPLK